MKESLKKKMDEVYENLTIEERIDLIIKAGQRGDREEVRRIMSGYQPEGDDDKLDFGDILKALSTDSRKIMTALMAEALKKLENKD